MDTDTHHIIGDTFDPSHSNDEGSRASDNEQEDPEYIGKQNTGDKNLGKRTINYFGSLVLNTNNITGPGMLGVPLAFQQAGYVVPIFAIIYSAIISSFGSTCICEAITLIPKNRFYQQRVEYSTVVRYYFGHKFYIFVQALYNINLLSLNIASMIAMSQVVDQFFLFAFGHSWAIQLIPTVKVLIASPNEGVPFANDGFLILTAGFMVGMVICMPLGFLNLDENIYTQYGCFFSFFLIMIEFFYAFISRGFDPSNIPVFGKNYTNVFGFVTISFAFVCTVPSWANEKKPNVNVNSAIWFSTGLCTIIYILFGVLGGLAYTNASPNILINIANPTGGKKAALITKISVYLFSLVGIGLGIPLYSVMVRYNLFVGKVFGKFLSGFCGVVLPWIIAAFFYQGDGFTIFVNWSTLFVGTAINFVIPFWVYSRARRIHEFRRNINDEGGSLSDGAINPTGYSSVENYQTTPNVDIWNMVDEEFKGAPVLRAMPRKWKNFAKKFVPNFLWISITIFALITFGLMINSAVHHH